MKSFFTAFIILNIFAGIAHAGDHKMGSSQACFYDSNWGHNKWRYYYCGAQSRGCAGKSGKGKNDVHLTVYHGQSFTFEKGNKDTYFCCHGTSSEMGIFTRADKWNATEKKEEIRDLGNGQFCKRYTYTNVCGEPDEDDCNTPETETCGTGYVWRDATKSCAKICTDGQVFEEYTNNCISCETTVHQGIDATEPTKPYCKKCGKDTHFFNPTDKTCVAKSGLLAHTKFELKKCWQCPSFDDLKACITAKGEPTGATKTNCKIQ